MPAHGEHVPGKGWYSAVHKGYMAKPDKIGEVRSAPAPQAHHAAEVAGWGKPKPFKENPDYFAFDMGNSRNKEPEQGNEGEMLHM